MMNPHKKEEIIAALGNEFGIKLRELLENRHIYQKISINYREVANRVLSDIGKGYHNDIFVALHDDFKTYPLTFGLVQLYHAEKGSNGRLAIPMLIMKTVKLYCNKCKTQETFKPIWWQDAINEMRNPKNDLIFDPPLTAASQIFFMAYQCERCHGFPDAFIVRRSEWTLFLEGRSPFENIETPKHIPSIEASFYRDALIAYHGGKTLAALFYLRVFIEQFVRRLTGKIDDRITGEDLMDEYSRMLPIELKDRMPSFKSWYEKISQTLHSANADEKLFEEALEAINQHFEIRKAHKLG